MLGLFGYIVVSILLLLVGYILSVFSNAVYIDPDEIRGVFPTLSERRKQRLRHFLSNPRAFFQMGLIVRISASVLLGALTMLISRKIGEFELIPDAPVYLINITIMWAMAVTFFIYLPRRLSIGKATARLVRFLPLVSILYNILLPFINVFSKISQSGTKETVSEEQKDDIVERAIETLAESAGISSPIIEEDEKEMIHQIFQLDVTEVEEIMVPRIKITGIEFNQTLEHIRGIIGTYGFSRYPVYDESIDKIRGILYVKDLLLLSEYERNNFVLTNHIRKPLIVSEHKIIDQLLAEFKKTKKHVAIVIDEFGGTSGLVTLEDILEEIVGEIEDEHDPEHGNDLEHLKNGAIEVAGTYPLEELAEELDIEFEQDEFETVSGMIYDAVGSVPTEGMSISWENCKIKVLEVEGQQISKVLVIPPQNRK
ncbi:MAG: HlyC/CorC family transporter [candidate division Zixibacteria bacterium]|nr:HlyC/CorC family transporter [candidate division Zixibacteria bacterium]